MPLAPRSPLPRARRAGVTAAGVLVALVLGATAGCTELDDAGPGTTRNDMVTELAARLGRSASLTYSATYQLTGGATATVVQAQQPARSAVLYPGGRISVTADATTECRTAAKRLTCTMHPPPAPTGPLPATLFAEPGRHGMVDPAAVLNLLGAVALDPDLPLTPHDTTIAGRHATCVKVGGATDAPASRFQTCITSEGVLGSFTGRLDGAAVDVAMTRFEDTADSTAFDPPPTAAVIDRRRR